MFGVAIPFVINSSSKNKYQDELFVFFRNLSLLISFIVITVLIILGNFFSDLIFGDSQYKIYLFVLGLYIISDIISEYFNLYNRIRSNLITHSKFILFRSLVKIASLIIPYIIYDDFVLAYFISSISYILFIILFSRKSQNNIFQFFQSFMLIVNPSRITGDGTNFLSLFLLNTFSTLLINLILVNQFNVETLQSIALI